MIFERLLAGCLGLLFLGTALQAQSNFTYTPVRQFYASFFEGEQLYAYTMNDKGEVAVVGRSPAGMTLYFNDGTDSFENWDVVYSGEGPLSTRIGMNDERWISIQGGHDFGSGIPESGALFFAPGFNQNQACEGGTNDGTACDADDDCDGGGTCGAGDQPLFRPLDWNVGNSQSTHRLNDDKNIAMYKNNNPSGSWGTIGAVDDEESSTSAKWNDSSPNGPHGGPTINEAGQVAEVGHRQIDGQEHLVLADWDPQHCPGTKFIP